MTEAARLPASRLPASLPPRWFVRAARVGHRAIFSITGGRRGLRRPTAERWVRWAVFNPKLDAYAAGRSRPTQVVILEPGPD